MPTPKRKPPVVDPAQVANQRILAMREKRIQDEQLKDELDLGLNLKEDTSPAENAADLIRDEFDKKAFGAPKFTTRVIYGPDPIVNNCPAFHERLEQFGLEAVAEAFRELILAKGDQAATDEIMRKGIRKSIERFGREATAVAFRDRIMQIPARTVEIEVDTELDPLLSNPMREAVARYGRPGMAVKFLSDRCCDVLGMRGYQIVRKPNGDPVKIGTLMMGEIPQDMADRRRLHWARESEDAMAQQAEAFSEAAEKAIRDAKTSGVSALQAGELIRRSSDVNDEWLNDARANGVHIGRRTE